MSTEEDSQKTIKLSKDGDEFPPHDLVDGDYDIWVRGKIVKIYCSGMSNGSPLEYLSLPSGHFENFSEIFSRR